MQHPTDFAAAVQAILNEQQDGARTIESLKAMFEAGRIQGATRTCAYVTMRIKDGEDCYVEHVRGTVLENGASVERKWSTPAPIASRYAPVRSSDPLGVRLYTLAA